MYIQIIVNKFIHWCLFLFIGYSSKWQNTPKEWYSDIKSYGVYVWLVGDAVNNYQQLLT